MKKRYIFSLLSLCFASFLYCESNKLEVNTFVYKSPKLPENFDGFTIAHVSDLHNKSFGCGQKKLIGKLSEMSPDIIAVTGDIINKRSSGMKNAVDFIKKASDIAPIYFVPGNHEIQFSERRTLYKIMENLGVSILINEKEALDINRERINIWGLDPINEYVKCLKKIKKEEKEFNIVLSHRPDRFRLYAKSHADLILSGHAHGGFIRISGKPLYAPNQGFYPKYACDVHTLGKSTMIVSRGLGDAVIPVRIANRPEIIEVILKKE